MKDFEGVVVPDKQQDSMLDLVQGGSTVQRQQSTYVTAVSVIKSRKLGEVLERVKSEVELDPLGAFYGWDVNTKKGGGKKHVEGMTIGLAMSIARNYGNCAIDLTVEETYTHHIFKPVFLDLETGFTFSRAFKQRKGQNIGMKDSERAEDLTFQLGQSKAIRNVIKGAIPSALVVNAIEYAHKCERAKWTPDKIAEKKQAVIKAFKDDFKITIEQLSEYMGEEDSAKWNLDKIIDLRSIYKAMKSGELSASDVFPAIETPLTEERPSDEMTLNTTPEKSKKKTAKADPEKEKPPVPIMEHPETATGPDEDEHFHENGHVFSAGAVYLYEEIRPDPGFDPRKDK